MRPPALSMLLIGAVVFLVGCGSGGGGNGGDGNGNGGGGGDDGNGNGGGVAPNRLQPDQLHYRGAFRLPGPSGGSNWEYSGDALTYCAQGDPTGPADGYPGSLYGVGHDWHKQVSEISIPVPVVSAGKSLAGLNTATTLRPFTDVRAGIAQLGVFDEQVRVGIACMPPMPGHPASRLYLVWGQHYQEPGSPQVAPSMMSCDLNLAGAAGAWWIGDHSLYRVNDYLFEIPQAWAGAHTPGMRLASGRFRDGGWGGRGPNLIASAPWNHGNPPPPGTVLEAVQLLGYTSTLEDPPHHSMTGYHHSDDWTGGAWLTAEDTAAVLFVGTKGVGDCWYGLPDGTVWPDSPPYPADPENQRGWWSTGFVAQMVFYDPNDLAAVAAGAAPHTPQPYASLDLGPVLFRSTGPQQKRLVGAVGFDRARGLLYLMEPLSDGDRSIVHVWAVSA